MPANNQIGAKIKGLREMKLVSIEDLAERSHLTVDQIRQIEAGEVTTSLTPLLAIARGLGVRLGTFLDDAELSGPVVSRAGANELNPVRFSGAGEGSGLDYVAVAVHVVEVRAVSLDVEVLVVPRYLDLGADYALFFNLFFGHGCFVFSQKKKNAGRKPAF